MTDTNTTSEKSVVQLTIDEVSLSARLGANSDTRVVDGIKVDLPYGKVARQGDVYIRRLRIEDVDVSKYKLLPASSRKIVTGNTVGSRHVVTSEGVKIYDRGGDELQGPVIIAEDGFYLSHPKHADFDIRLPGAYECSFPVDQHALELGEIRRRAD